MNSPEVARRENPECHVVSRNPTPGDRIPSIHVQRAPPMTIRSIFKALFTGGRANYGDSASNQPRDIG